MSDKMDLDEQLSIVRKEVEETLNEKKAAEAEKNTAIMLSQELNTNFKAE